MSKAKTIFCDIDGTLCEYPYTGTKNGNYDSAKRVAQEYGFLCEVFNDCGEMKVGLWEKAILSSTN